MDRFRHIQYGVAHANSIEDVLKTRETQPNVYFDFKSRTTWDLNYELQRIERLMDFSASTFSIEFMTKHMADEGPPFKFSPEDFVRYQSIVFGQGANDLKDLKEDELVRLKTFVEQFIYHVLTDLHVHSQVHLWPKCTFINSIIGVQNRGSSKVIEVEPYRPSDM